MISLQDAQSAILRAASLLPTRKVARADAAGLVLAEAVVSNEPVPPFSNTAMDGYAVRVIDTAGACPESPVRLHVVGDLPAGQAPTVAVETGEAIRIMTGAPIPAGADAVVMVEATRVDGDGVLIAAAAEVGEHLRAAGGDVEAGDRVFEAGTVLTPAHLGVLASLDVREVMCYPRARVGVMSTGDELVETGALTLGRIRDSNRPMLLAVVAEAGCEAVDYGIVRDDEDGIAETIARAASECDAVLTSGAVSVGDYDFVKSALERLARDAPGSAFTWSQVAIKPAKPLAFGVLGGVPVFGLPGNPVSSRVSFEMFARPALRKMMGHEQWFRSEIIATAATPLRRRPDGKLHLDRVHVYVDEGRFACERAGVQASNVLSGMAAANGLALVPDGDGVDSGGEVRVLLIDSSVF